MHAHIRFVLNGFPPINRLLPPEALAIIPSFLVHDRDRIIATHVCRYWRNTFLSTPSLWNSVSTFEYPEQTKTYLERSGDAPLNIFIGSDKSWTPGTIASLQMLGSLSNRCQTVRLVQDHVVMDVLPIIQNPCPRLTELYLEINLTSFYRIENLDNFPSLKSLTLIGDPKHLRFSQPLNLRKLGLGCSGVFRLAPLLEVLARIPLLEEFEFNTPGGGLMIVKDSKDTQSPVALTRLQRLVFRGARSEFPRTLSLHITYPKSTKIILTYHLPHNSPFKLNILRRMFPPRMQLPIVSPPKFVRYHEIQDEDLSETRYLIDLISIDGQHTSLENRYGWPGESSIQEKYHQECLGFLRTLDLSHVERFCIEGSNPNPGLLEGVMGNMTNLGTLVVVDGYPSGVFTGLKVREPSAVICPLLRRLIVRQDIPIPMHWHLLLPIVHDRAGPGSPLEQVTLTSSSNELPEEPEGHMEELERTVEVTYDLGRNTLGWDWRMV